MWHFSHCTLQVTKKKKKIITLSQFIIICAICTLYQFSIFFPFSSSPLERQLLRQSFFFNHTSVDKKLIKKKFIDKLLIRNKFSSSFRWRITWHVVSPSSSQSWTNCVLRMIFFLLLHYWNSIEKLINYLSPFQALLFTLL